MEGIVFNIQRYSIDDGPGVRTTVFLKGCPLTCLWCSNPESQNPEPEITWRYTSCIRCGTCVKTCPLGLITLDDEGVHINRKECTRCGKCIETCKPGALQMSGRKMTVEEVYSTVKRDIDFYKVSGGGCTCSGGEILMQADFVAELFKLCKADGIHTCADTTGFGSEQALEKILEYTDLVYFDLKHMDPEKHKEYCGVSNDVILKSLALIIEKKIETVIRVPLIPGYNDSDENISELGKTVSGLTKDVVVNLLPYHRYGENKYRMVDMVYQLSNVPTPTEEQLNKAKEIIESYGLKCEISK
ncbi:MAG: glycyl-radical enzyme activating protein [Spirochaetes bacterium]|nr:glycyl-radical enzyme activating protein [Spirochaetota bacterium]